MPKRIALFILGVVIAVGAFLLYQLITGASIGPTVKPRGLAITEPANTGIDITEMDGERPVYEITAAGSPEQIKDASGNPRPGQFRLHQLLATWYDKSGRTLEVRGDICDIQMAPGVAAAGAINPGGGGPPSGVAGIGAGGKNVDITRLHWEDFSGSLQGHVTLTISPLPVGAGGTAAAKDPLPSGLRIYFDEPLKLDGAQSLLTTNGGIHIRSSVIESDGTGLQMVLNPNTRQQQIELLLLKDNPAGNRIIFRGAGAKAKIAGFTNRPDADKKTAAQPGDIAKGPPPATPGASTRNGKAPPAPPITYRLSFGHNIIAKAQQGTLTSERLYLMFTPTHELAGPETSPAKPGDGSAAAMASAPAPMHFPDEPAPIAPVQPDDLAVSWSGEMELRPMDPNEASQLALRGPNDFALDAQGTPDDPVTLTQTTAHTALASAGEKTATPSRESTITIRAGHLLYPGQGRPITISPGDVAQVMLHQVIKNLLKPGDVSDQQITCGEVTYTPDAAGPNKDHAVLAGPGTLVSKTPAEQLTAKWVTRMDVDLAPPPGSQSTSDKAITRAVLQGAAIASAGGDSDLDMSAQLLDVQMANYTLNGKAAQTPEKLFAQGGVEVKTWKKETPANGGKSAAKVIADDRRERPDGIETDSLTILSKPVAGSLAPVLSQMIADGHVTAWRYSTGTNDLGLGAAPDAGANAAMIAKGPREWTKNSLITQHLVTDLSMKAPTETRPAVAAGSDTANAFDSVVGNVEPSHVQATGGVRVLIEPPAASTRLAVDLTADALDADPVHLSAHFTAAKTPGAAPVVARRGNDSITALVMDLSQSKENSKHDILDIPGAGSFEFQSHDAADKMPHTYLANWSASMHYDSLEQLATIKGHPVVRVEGDDQQLDSLRCDDSLNVHLKPRPKTGTPSAVSQDDTSLDLAWLEAIGNVQASGVLLADEKKPGATKPGAVPEKLLEMSVSANDQKAAADHPAVPGRLRFDAASQTFEIPGGGALVINDHRTKTAGQSVFGWQQSMKFDGSDNTVKFNGGVHFIFTPEKGFNFLNGSASAAPVKNPGNGKQQARLATDQLTAKLVKAQTSTAPSAKSPIAFEASGLDSVTATGHVQIDFGDVTLTGVRLTYDMPTQIATIDGTEDDLASFQQPGGRLVEADSFVLDTTKDKEALTAKNPRGNFNGFMPMEKDNPVQP